MHKIRECRPMIFFPSDKAAGSNLPVAQNLVNFASEHEYRFAGYAICKSGWIYFSETDE